MDVDSPNLPKKRIRRETTEQRERRLERQRAYNQRRRRADEVHDEADPLLNRESEAKRQHRLKWQREYNRKRRASTQDSGNFDLDHVVPESTVDRDKRLLRQREYDRSTLNRFGGQQQRIGITPDLNVDFVSIPGYEESPDTDDLTPITDARRHDIEVQLQSQLGAPGLDERVCAVCDRLVLRRLSSTIMCGQEQVFPVMRRVLRPPRDLPRMLTLQYDCADIDFLLDGMMLSRSGIKSTEHRTQLIICDDCNGVLSKGSDKPPKFAIANGFFVGLLPLDQHKATWIEKVMTQLVTVVAQTRVMRGGSHRAIRSHCMVFDATPGPPATLLPRRIDSHGPYRVVLAGPLTRGQHAEIRKLHQARGDVVNKLLAFYMENNHLYGDVKVDDIANAIDATDGFVVEHADCEQSDMMDLEQGGVGNHQEGYLIAEDEDECSVIERTILLSDEKYVENAVFAQRVVDLNPQQPNAIPKLRVDHSSRFANSQDLEAKMFPHLFPFGRGHPQEKRVTYVSKRDCLRHYIMLSSRRFAQDPTFTLTSFARLSMENMYTLTSVKCKRYEGIFDGYESISREDLATALVNNERRQRGERCKATGNPVADRFLKSVELGSVSVWGSSAERRQCRQEAFGYQTRFGQPSLFVTLTPNTDNSFAMAHYTGNLSVETLFDVLEARVPSAVDMKQAAMGDDCASARLFMRIVDAFISEVLGVDLKTMVSNDAGGLFGKTRAFYGMVETQGHGTLHIHFLVWLSGAPINSRAFDDKLSEHGSTFTSSLEAYADSIITNHLPLPIDNVECQNCRSTGTLSGLVIPVNSRRNEGIHQREAKSEPLLVRCDACLFECSSQHILRQTLFQNRPPHWPPPLRPLTDEERKRRIQIERCARQSNEDAARIVDNRERFYSLMEQDESEREAEWWLKSTDVTQGSRIRLDADPMRCDPMHRLIEMMPPSADSMRMQPHHRAYSLSSLVLNFNHHSWMHTGSCFKSSKISGTQPICRYGFPRERVQQTSVIGPKVAIKRSLAHEYVNGYNPTIMEAFKCNHDVQILFGGKDAINRIYYCCKYVTKPQKQIDSTTAVALASFERRAAKETVAQVSGTPLAARDAQRRRVTSMVHAVTNKQEIAGPLAALYLLRGSCRYSSDLCAKLQLADVLQQVERRGGYMCTLVPQPANGSATFTSASSLDDYVYRPVKVSGSSLYLFTMKYYRRSKNGDVGGDYRFTSEHPLVATHCIAYRKRDAVPIIKGPRLQRWKPDMTDDDREAYAKIAMVLFKPFRSLDDLLGNDAAVERPWLSAYSKWEPERDEFTKTIMRNMDDYHAGRDSEHEFATNASSQEWSEPVDDTSDVSSCDDGYSPDDWHQYLEGADEPYNGTSDHIEDSEQQHDEVQVFPGPAEHPSSIQETIERFMQHGLVGEFARQVANTHSTERQSLCLEDFSPSMLRKWVASGDCDNLSKTIASGEGTPDRALCTEWPTTVNELIDQSLQPDQVRWNVCSPVGQFQQTPDFCRISELSRLFTLNELQHAAFAMVATHLLRRWRVVMDEVNTAVSDAEMEKRQLCMFLGGEGGTGKSRVIGAIQEFCRSWQHKDSLVLAAMTGKAASLINGKTLASYLMSLKRTGSHSAVMDLDCLIVDEISMMSKLNLLRLHQRLCSAKHVSDAVPFGGVHIILVGDFLQLPPVGADPIFVDPFNKANASPYDIEGFKLWRTFDKVVVLNESVRFRDDPEWGEGCSRARYGEWTPAFVKIINSRLLEQNCTPKSAPVQVLPSGTVFVTPDNSTRTAINGFFIAATAKEMVNDYPIRVVANFQRALKGLSSQDISYIMSLPDTRFGRMAPYLDLIRGLPIQITQNIRTKKGVANGTMGTLHSVQFPADTTFRKVFDRCNRVVVLLPDKRPLYALVSLDRGKNAIPICDGVEKELFPVFPDATAYNLAHIELTPRSDGSSRSISVKIQQFPFVCAVGATVYKVQGDSLNSIAVVEWKADCRGANRPQQPYLMVSRAVCRNAFSCLKPLTPQVIAWSKPPLVAVREDERLQEVSKFTLEAFFTKQSHSTYE